MEGREKIKSPNQRMQQMASARHVSCSALADSLRQEPRRAPAIADRGR